MKVYAISDLHLGLNVDKPMDIFGPEWKEHGVKIAGNWSDTVSENDLVLLPGDLSWAMSLEDARADLDLIDSLPGHKMFIRGNHDYWLSSPSKVRGILGSGMELIRFDAATCGPVGVCGVRGWPWPGYGEYDEEADRRHYHRELERLRLSLDALDSLPWRTACAMMHYPPLTERDQSEFCRMVRDAGVEWVVYGHVHGHGADGVVEGLIDGVHYLCVSADRIGFRPRALFEA